MQSYLRPDLTLLRDEADFKELVGLK